MPYRITLYDATGKAIKRSKPLPERPTDTFIANSYFLWPKTFRHEIEEDEG